MNGMGTEGLSRGGMLEAPMRLRLFSERFSAAFSVFFVLALTIFSAGQAHAQVTGATLSGTVMDDSGAVIPGVQVSIKNRATGVVRNVTTDEAGFYSAPNLLSGNFVLCGPAPGDPAEFAVCPGSELIVPEAADSSPTHLWA
jgi:hypothetical protein